MTKATKIALICTLLITVGCTATLIVVSNSDRTSIDIDSNPKLDSGIDVGIDIKRDSLNRKKKQ